MPAVVDMVLNITCSPRRLMVFGFVPLGAQENLHLAKHCRSVLGREWMTPAAAFVI